MKNNMTRGLDLWRSSLNPFEDDWFDSNFKKLFDLVPNDNYWKDKGISFNPKCDLAETNALYTMKFDLPGLTKDQIKIDLQENRMTVSGERRDERKEENKDARSYLSEVHYGAFTRSFTFPTPVNPEKVEAKYENGVLTINVNKDTKATPRQINIK